jgi:hypothetical protein
MQNMRCRAGPCAQVEAQSEAQQVWVNNVEEAKVLCGRQARASADIVLTEPGLGTIVDAIIIARRIFRRIAAFLNYRIAATLQLLLFFFIAVFAFEPQRYNPAVRPWLRTPCRAATAMAWPLPTYSRGVAGRLITRRRVRGVLLCTCKAVHVFSCALSDQADVRVRRLQACRPEGPMRTGSCTASTAQQCRHW